jgi:hypothetical protein
VQELGNLSSQPQLAQEEGFTELAALGGLTVLAALPVLKLRELPSTLVDFVLECAGAQSENAVVIQHS